MSDVGRQWHVVVIKLGGSILTDAAAYERCARHIQRRIALHPDERYVIAASAQGGATDELQTLAAGLCPQPAARTLDLLWATGELRSVALLTLCLQRLDVDAIGLNVHETGLQLRDGDPATVELYPRTIWHHVRRHAVTVVPGFLATDARGGIVSLGRGGSDLSAVLLAAELPTSRCELIKDVPGYFTRDPHVHADAEPVAQLDYAQALALAAEGCDLVQERALAVAARTNTPLVIRSLDETATHTVVCDRDAVRRVAGHAERPTAVMLSAAKHLATSGVDSSLRSE